MYAAKPKFKLKSAILLSTLLLNSATVFALEEYIQQQKGLSFGKTVARIGSCELDPISAVLSSPQSTCFGFETLGHYKIFGDPNKMLKVKLQLVNDIPSGIHFAPKGRLVNNLGDDISAPIAGADTWIRIGSDGVLDIYVGGTLTISQVLNSGSSFVLQYDIEYAPP